MARVREQPRQRAQISKILSELKEGCIKFYEYDKFKTYRALKCYANFEVLIKVYRDIFWAHCFQFNPQTFIKDENSSFKPVSSYEI